MTNHGVDFTEAQRTFADPKALVLFDGSHSPNRELRWWLLGWVDSRVMLVRYTHRPGGVIRRIGAGSGEKVEFFMKHAGKNIRLGPVFDANGHQTNMRSLNGDRLPDLSRVKTKPFHHGGARRGAGQSTPAANPFFCSYPRPPLAS